MNSEREIDVIVYGTVCLDAVWTVNALPPSDGFAHIQSEKEMIGGEACNTAIALHRWGANVVLVGNAIGVDERGKKLLDMFQRDVPGLILDYIRIDETAITPFCACIATPDGNRTMFGTGFSELYCPEISLELARSAKYFTMDPNGWHSGIKAAELADEAGCKVISMDYADSDKVCSFSDLLLISHNRFPGAGLDVLKSRAKKLSQKHRTRVIITCGESGCIYANFENSEFLRFHALPAEKLIDATGAGDIFRAGIIYGQIAGWGIVETIQFATTASSLNCEQPGGWGGVRSFAETMSIVHERGRSISEPTPC